MPELPDVTVYVEALEQRIAGTTLHETRLKSPFLLRTAVPPLASASGRRVAGVRRLGKRIAVALEGELFLVLHLMIAGRLHSKERGAALPRRTDLAAFDFDAGTLVLTEAGTKKRASLHVVDASRLAGLDRGGLEVLQADLGAFAQRLAGARHTLKRALCDPGLFSGIGNAYSDEILHRARLSPLQRPENLDEDELARLFDATRAVLSEWTERLRRAAGTGFPLKVTAFRPEMAVHGRFGKPCPVCGAPVQRIVRAANEMNYCDIPVQTPFDRKGQGRCGRIH
jgi:formamidopyrimidine-DNA glycosylase